MYIFITVSLLTYVTVTFVSLKPYAEGMYMEILMESNFLILNKDFIVESDRFILNSMMENFDTSGFPFDTRVDSTRYSRNLIKSYLLGFCL